MNIDTNTIPILSPLLLFFSVLSFVETGIFSFPKGQNPCLKGSVRFYVAAYNLQPHLLLTYIVQTVNIFSHRLNLFQNIVSWLLSVCFFVSHKPRNTGLRTKGERDVGAKWEYEGEELLSFFLTTAFQCLSLNYSDRKDTEDCTDAAAIYDIWIFLHVLLANHVWYCFCGGFFLASTSRGSCLLGAVTTSAAWALQTSSFSVSQPRFPEITWGSARGGASVIPTSKCGMTSFREKLLLAAPMTEICRSATPR